MTTKQALIISLIVSVIICHGVVVWVLDGALNEKVRYALNVSSS